MGKTADVIAVQCRIAPELAEKIVLRHLILRHVSYSQPIGRRALAQCMRRSEREVRREEGVLREVGLIVVGPDGIRLSRDGEDILWELGEYVRLLTGTGELETTLVERFGLEQAVVVTGDADRDDAVKREIARAGAALLRDVISDGDVVAVTGGTTMAALAQEAVELRSVRDLVVVPARGGLGEDVEKQADTVAASLAKKLGGSYRLLNLPDDLGLESAASVREEPRIKQVLDTIRQASVVVHGVGTAVEMARRRNLSEAEIAHIQQLGAVGESFGFYFNSAGEVVYTTSSLGLRLADLSSVPTVICVGGGASKSEALSAVLRNGFSHIVVTDEGAAREIKHESGR